MKQKFKLFFTFALFCIVTQQLFAQNEPSLESLLPQMKKRH